MYSGKKGDKLAGIQVIPLVVKDEKLKENNCKMAVLLVRLRPITEKSRNSITTGSEVFKGIIKDTFTPVVFFR